MGGCVGGCECLVVTNIGQNCLLYNLIGGRKGAQRMRIACRLSGIAMPAASVRDLQLKTFRRFVGQAVVERRKCVAKYFVMSTQSTVRCHSTVSSFPQESRFL